MRGPAHRWTTRRHVACRAAIVAIGLIATIAGGESRAGEAADPLDRLVGAISRFRGIGDSSVSSYRVELHLPDEEEESPPLFEMWRAPDDLALQAARPGTPRAIVRSLAFYLEPLYVARSSFLRTDLEGSAQTVRNVASLDVRSDETGDTVTLDFPTPADEGLPGALRDVLRLSARLDDAGRLASLDVDLRGAGTDGGAGRLGLLCTPSTDPHDPQPEQAVWTLPDGRTVTIRTEFREEDGRRVPGARTIVFPSRYDPGETEEILVVYGVYDFNVEFGRDDFEGSGVFRFDPDGLMEE